MNQNLSFEFRKRYGVRLARLILVAGVIALFGNVFNAQAVAAQDSVADLQAKLGDVEVKRSDVEAQIASVDEQMKPENIQMSLAGVGTLHPEVLREQRRKQLETQKRGLQSQLESLNASKAHLEGAILHAQNASYVDSANGPNAGESSSGTPRHHRSHHKSTHKKKTTTSH